MPIITVQLTEEGYSKEQKADLIQELTNVVVRVLNKPPALTHVLIQEIPVDNWGVAGLPAMEFRKQLNIESGAK